MLGDEWRQATLHLHSPTGVGSLTIYSPSRSESSLWERLHKDKFGGVASLLISQRSPSIGLLGDTTRQPLNSAGYSLHSAFQLLLTF